MASQMTKVNKVKFIKDIQVPNMTVTGDIEISGNMTVGAIKLGEASYGTEDIGEGAYLPAGQLYFVYEE